jgi:hypothetical protein
MRYGVWWAESVLSLGHLYEDLPLLVNYLSRMMGKSKAVNTHRQILSAKVQNPLTALTITVVITTHSVNSVFKK